MTNKTNKPKRTFKQRSLYIAYKDLVNYIKFINIIKKEIKSRRKSFRERPRENHEYYQTCKHNSKCQK